VLHENQGGFREGKWTVDWVFVLQGVIEHYKLLRKPLYVCFFDARKAFDTVWRERLFLDMHGVGIQGRILRVLWDMYSSSSGRVLVNGMVSGEFPVEQGVKQGGVSSPFLYLLFVNFLIKELESRGLGVRCFGKWVGALLFADDVVVLCSSSEELQVVIEVVAQFAKLHRFVMAASKSKVITFNVPFCKHQFWMEGEQLEEVREWVYLGVVVGRGRVAASHYKKRVARMEEASRVIRSLRVADPSFSLSAAIRLFGCVVDPVGLYGAEIIMPPKYLVVLMDRVALRFFKSVVGASQSTSSVGVRGEFGLWGYLAKITVRHLVYGWRLLNCGVASLLGCVFDRMRRSEWLSRLRTLAESVGVDLGLARTVRLGVWKKLVCEAVRRHEELEWRQELDESVVLSYNYVGLKRDLALEPYLCSCFGEGARLKFKLRVGSNALMANVGRFHKMLREERVCLLCRSGELEDVTHFLAVCDCWDEERARWRESLCGLVELSHLDDSGKLRAKEWVHSLNGKCLMEFLLGYNTTGGVLLDWAGGLCNEVERVNHGFMVRCYRSRLDKIDASFLPARIAVARLHSPSS
jgi:hypothetical protein